jgi:hypothetical protein
VTVTPSITVPGLSETAPQGFAALVLLWHFRLTGMVGRLRCGAVLTGRVRVAGGRASRQPVAEPVEFAVFGHGVDGVVVCDIDRVTKQPLETTDLRLASSLSCASLSAAIRKNLTSISRSATPPIPTISSGIEHPRSADVIRLVATPPRHEDSGTARHAGGVWSQLGLCVVVARDRQREAGRDEWRERPWMVDRAQPAASGVLLARVGRWLTTSWTTAGVLPA